ncbi:MAG TPA: hypothetical protein VL691_24460 [Vicinamibacteria bacterium]|nr:hypothetical protein [Vicinamibacteria bacterium]
MKKVLWSGVLALAVVALAALVPPPAQAQERLEGKAFDSACVRDFYLEGNSIPTQKRNTVVLKGTDGKRLVFGLLDTSGYSAEVQQKYAGMMIVERKVVVGGTAVGTGAYGFGLQKPTPPEGAGKLIVYDVSGAKVGEAAAQYDATLAQPVPLQFVIKDSRLYVGRHWVEIK